MSKFDDNSESCDEYLARIKATYAPSVPRSNAAKGPEQLEQGGAIFSARTQELLTRFNGFEQKKVLKLWYDLTACFGQGRIRQEFGDEPDRHLIRLAIMLDENSHRRLMDNLNERLRKGQEWPPSIAMLEALSRTPTDKEILEARTNILTLKKPISRIEKYISKRKSAKLKTLSEKYITQEFKTLYLEAFEEVVFNDKDKLLDEEEKLIADATTLLPRTKFDTQLDDLIAQGYKPNNALNQRLMKLDALRKKKNNHG